MSTPTVAESQHTPDVLWGSRADGTSMITRRDRRRPRTRIGRGIRRLLGQWWIHTTYIGAIIGTALYFLAPPAAADEQVLTFSAPAVKYAAEHAEDICLTLDTSSPAQVGELLHKLQFLGDLNYQQAGEAMYFSVVSVCPIHLQLLDDYASMPVVAA